MPIIFHLNYPLYHRTSSSEENQLKPDHFNTLEGHIPRKNNFIPHTDLMLTLYDLGERISSVWFKF